MGARLFALRAQQLCAAKELVHGDANPLSFRAELAGKQQMADRLAPVNCQ